MNETYWRPHNYDKERWTPDPDEMLLFHLTGVKVNHDPVKPPTLVISMRATGRRDGKHKWSGSIYLNFGRSDAWDNKIGAFVLFLLNVARQPVTPQPDWDEVTSRLGLHAFLGRLTANDYKGRRYHNIVSIQRSGQVSGPGVVNYWTTDGMVFRSDFCDDLVSTEEYDGPPEWRTPEGYPCDEYGNITSNKKYIPPKKKVEPLEEDAVIDETEEDSVIDETEEDSVIDEMEDDPVIDETAAPPLRSTPLTKEKTPRHIIDVDLL